jgi:putative membrane protein
MDHPSLSDPSPVGRSLFGGFLMGLANLVPGISGGTMILAIGLYDRFIGAIADVTRLRFSRVSIGFLGLVACGAGLAVLALSGLLVGLVVEHRWVMYSLFVGMTLGGVPELARAARPLDARTLACALAGVGLMAWLAFALRDTRLPQTMPVLVLVGAVAASSMILPGISGSYLLLIFGMYELVIGSMSTSALREDLGGSARVVLPFLAGAGLGVGLLSNVLKLLLARFPAPSHAALLGLLCGSVLGLWPFQRPVDVDLAHKETRKAVAQLLAGATHDAVRAVHGAAYDDERLAAFSARYAGLDPAELKLRGGETAVFRPAAGEVAGAFALLALGFAVTRLVGRGSGARAPSAPRAA